LLYYTDALNFEDKTFYGYIAGSKVNAGGVVIAIRGTEDAAEWLLDFLAVAVPFTSAPDAGFVALGFQNIFDSFELIDSSGTSITLKRSS